MKKIIYVTVVVMALTACTKESPSFLDKWGLKSYQNVCYDTDAVVCPEPHSMEAPNTSNIPDETIHSMSTCGLLETWLGDVYRNMAGPWKSHLSDIYLPGVSMFNNELENDKVAKELFKRVDGIEILISKYLYIVEEKVGTDGEDTTQSPTGFVRSFEMLLASDMCMAVLNEKEKTLFMAMAVERINMESDYTNETHHIMLAIMRSCKYKPFLENVGAEFAETTWGYEICLANPDIIRKYAVQFLNEQN